MKSNQNNMQHPLTTDSLVHYKGRYYTGTDIAAMREWISDCRWPDLDSEDIEELTPNQVLAGIARNVDGGLSEFMSNMI